MGRGARLVAIRRLAGATTAAVHVVEVEDRDGRRHRLVLKRYSDDPSEPDSARREARILRLIHGIPSPRRGGGRAGRGVFPAPELIAVDPDGESGDAPALLMTRLRVLLRPPHLRPWLRHLAALLPRIHAVDPRADPPPPYRPFYVHHPPGPPAWSRRQPMRERAIQVFAGPAPDELACFIHRDYHPTPGMSSGSAASRRGLWTGCIARGAPRRPTWATAG